MYSERLYHSVLVAKQIRSTTRNYKIREVLEIGRKVCTRPIVQSIPLPRKVRKGNFL